VRASPADRGRWTASALSDIDGILDEVGRHNPIAAIDLVEAIIASGNALRIFPARNPIRHDGKIRERPVLGTRYLLLYRIERRDVVYVIAIRHGARASRLD